MDSEGRTHKLLSEEELAALTEGLAAPARAVLTLSPFVSDQQVLARALREKGFRVIAAARATWPEGAVERIAAAVIAAEVLQEDPGAVARLRALRKDLPVYVIWDDLASAPPDIPPPAGIWARPMLGDCVGMLALSGEAACAATNASAPDAAAPPPPSPPPAVPTYAEILETLLAPAHDAPELVRRVLQALRAHCRVPAAAALIHHGGFFLEIDADGAALRGQAGRFLLETGRQFLFQTRPSRVRPNAFAAVDCMPIVRSGNALGALFLFFTKEAPAPDVERAAAMLASRLWELLARSSPSGAFLPYEAFLLEARGHAGALLLGAPLGEETLERMLGEGEFWTREPGGAVLVCLNRGADAVIGACGDDFAGFSTSAGRHADLGAWVRTHSEVLAELRRAGRRGIVPA